LTREIQAQERRTTALETTARHIEFDINKKTIELHSKILYMIYLCTSWNCKKIHTIII